MKQNCAYLSKAAQRLLLFGPSATLAFAQSGNISGSTSNFTTLGTTILTLAVALAGMGFVGLIIWGGLTLTTNRPRGLAMGGGGLVGALLSGLAYALVNTLTGHSVATGMLLLPVAQQFLGARRGMKAIRSASAKGKRLRKGMLRKTRRRGVSRVGWIFTFAAAAYNLVRMRTLLPSGVQTA